VQRGHQDQQDPLEQLDLQVHWELLACKVLQVPLVRKEVLVRQVKKVFRALWEQLVHLDQVVDPEVKATLELLAHQACCDSFLTLAVN